MAKESLGYLPRFTRLLCDIAFALYLPNVVTCRCTLLDKELSPTFVTEWYIRVRTCKAAGVVSCATNVAVGFLIISIIIHECNWLKQEATQKLHSRSRVHAMSKSFYSHEQYSSCYLCVVCYSVPCLLFCLHVQSKLYWGQIPVLACCGALCRLLWG